VKWPSRSYEKEVSTNGQKTQEHATGQGKKGIVFPENGSMGIQDQV